MWSHEASIETRAAPAVVWKILADVPGWKSWNAGIEHIELFGDFASGSRFSMQPPGSEPFTSTLVDVSPGVCFTDETVIDGTRVLVDHRLVPLPSGGTRIVYSTQIEGPAAAEFGPFVTGDFDAVLAALKALAEA